MGVYVEISVGEYISHFSQSIVPFIENSFLDRSLSDGVIK